jgi:hypothetical protein
LFGEKVARVKPISFSSSSGSLRKLFLGLLAFFCLLVVSACGGDSSVHIYDNAHVLDSSKVQRAASQLPNSLAVYTTGTFQGTQTAFQHTAAQKLNGDPNLIVMAIDTSHRYIYITRGSNVPLSGAGIKQAVNAFATNFDNGDYTNASVAAINSMHDSLNASKPSGNTGGIFANPFTLCCCIVPILLILLLVLVVAAKRGRIGRTGGTPGGWPFRRRPPPNPDPDPYNYGPPNQGPYYGPPNQGPYYGPPNQGGQGGGINPWAAGGLGAAAGGLAGYELGRLQGERERERGEDVTGSGGDFGGGGFDSGGGGGSFGGGGFDSGGGGDFGGGGNFGGGGFDSGGGSDFGGGGSFGGGDDSGGGNF